MKTVTLKQALGDDFLYNGGLWLIRCPKCHEESLAGCHRHYATNSWYDRNRPSKTIDTSPASVL